jgi:hypothetical protein
MPRREAKLVITPGTPCAVCSHPRSSHSMLVVLASCKVTGCACDSFEPVCGCGHLISWHTWGVPPYPWNCTKCPCKKFGAAPEESRVFQEALFDMTR